MKKFWNSKISDLTWGQYITMFAVIYAAMFGWYYKDTLLEKVDDMKEKIPHRKYAKRIEEENFDE